MRPEEIDYSDTRKHYFDLSNGEVLSGAADRKRYIEAAADPQKVVDLGYLLREPPEMTAVLDIQPIDTSDWSREEFLRFGKWIKNIVAEPTEPGEKSLNRDKVLKNAYQLGIGPGTFAIRETFGSYGKFYADIKAKNTHNIGIFKEWELENFVDYIKKIGGPKRPTKGDLKRLNALNPYNPDPEYMHIRFRDIGGFRKLLEMAGYPVIDLWEKPDYIDWGVKFMQANGGVMPTSWMADYLSLKTLGPAGTTICNNFVKISYFQNEVCEEWRRIEQEKEEDIQEKMAIIRAGILKHTMPIDLFMKPPEEIDSYGPLSLEQCLAQWSPEEVLKRYGKFKVLEMVAPSMTMYKKVEIVTDRVNGSGFVAAIRKSNDIAPEDIEYEALMLDVFDYIWPMDSHMETLKLDEGYRKYYQEREKVKKTRAPRPLVTLA